VLPHKHNLIRIYRLPPILEDAEAEPEMTVATAGLEAEIASSFFVSAADDMSTLEAS